MTLAPHPLDVEQAEAELSGRTAGIIIGCALLSFAGVLGLVIYLLARLGQ